LKRWSIQHFDWYLVNFSASRTFFLNIISPLQPPFLKTRRILQGVLRSTAELQDISIFEAFNWCLPTLSRRIRHHQSKIEITHRDSFLHGMTALVLCFSIPIFVADHRLFFDKFPLWDVSISTRTIIEFGIGFKRGLLLAGPEEIGAL
jgi:hypothetical protein